MTRHIEDIAAQTIMLLNEALELCIIEKQSRAMERAQSWLLDITNPLRDEVRDACVARLEEWAYVAGTQTFFDSKTDNDIRIAIAMLEQ